MLSTFEPVARSLFTTEEANANVGYFSHFQQFRVMYAKYRLMQVIFLHLNITSKCENIYHEI